MQRDRLDQIGRVLGAWQPVQRKAVGSSRDNMTAAWMLSRSFKRTRISSAYIVASACAAGLYGDPGG